MASKTGSSRHTKHNNKTLHKFTTPVEAKIASVLKEVEETFDNACKEVPDLLELMIDCVRDDVDKYELDSRNYNGPCFTRALRELMETNLKLHKELERIDLNGKPDMEDAMKQLARRNEGIWLTVYEKVHKMKCNDCEVEQI